MSYFIKKWFFEVTVNITLLIVPAYLITCSIFQYGRMTFSLSMPVTVYGLDLLAFNFMILSVFDFIQWPSDYHEPKTIRKVIFVIHITIAVIALIISVRLMA
ncbi:prophage P2b protein 21 [Lactiplantibacillus plantarum]|nr:prophage P2b protein 21 [Lactiplantibacillus plantarum]